MKKITVLASCFITLSLSAQNINLPTGTKLSGKSKVNMEMDMGMAGQMKTETTTSSVINVTGEEPTRYKADYTVTKIKIKGEGMGRAEDYDSDSKTDGDSEMGKLMGDKVNKTVQLFIDRSTGTVTEANPEKKDDNGDPFGGMMGEGASPEASLSAMFMLIPSDKKAGDSWTDSVTANGLKTIRNIKYVSLNNGIATLKINGELNATIEKETNGMQITVSMKGKTVNDAEVEIKSGVVKKNSGKADIDGTMEFMGQSMPITMTMKTDLDVE